MNANQITTALVESFKATRKAVNALEKAKDAINGPYNQAVVIATQADSRDELAQGFDGFFAAVRTDGRLANQVNAKPRKKPGKDGSKYTVPGSLMNAKSILLGADEFGVELVGDEGPQSFNAIRKAVNEAKAEAKAATATPDEKARAEAAEICKDIVSGLNDWGAVGLADMVETLRGLRDEIAGQNQAAESADIAEAA